MARNESESILIPWEIKVQLLIQQLLNNSRSFKFLVSNKPQIMCYYYIN